jgi:hypothetical protein
MKPLLPKILSAGPDDDGKLRVAIAFDGRKGDSVEFAPLTAKEACQLIEELSRLLRHRFVEKP